MAIRLLPIIFGYLTRRYGSLKSYTSSMKFRRLRMSEDSSPTLVSTGCASRATLEAASGPSLVGAFVGRGWPSEQWCSPHRAWNTSNCNRVKVILTPSSPSWRGFLYLHVFTRKMCCCSRVIFPFTLSSSIRLESTRVLTCLRRPP